MEEFDKRLASELVKCQPRTDAEIIEIVERILLDCGIGHKHFTEMTEVRRDLVWVRDARLRCEKWKTTAMGTVLGGTALALLTIIAMGIREWIEHG